MNHLNILGAAGIYPIADLGAQGLPSGRALYIYEIGFDYALKAWALLTDAGVPTQIVKRPSQGDDLLVELGVIE